MRRRRATVRNLDVVNWRLGEPETFFCRPATALVTDFGVARAFFIATTTGNSGTGSQTATGMSVGAPAHMSQEVARLSACKNGQPARCRLTVELACRVPERLRV